MPLLIELSVDVFVSFEELFPKWNKRTIEDHHDLPVGFVSCIFWFSATIDGLASIGSSSLICSTLIDGIVWDSSISSDWTTSCTTDWKQRAMQNFEIW